MRKESAIHEIEETARPMSQKIGHVVLIETLKIVDEWIESKVPAGWRNAGTENRRLISSMGVIRYKRYAYQDKDNESNF